MEGHSIDPDKGLLERLKAEGPRPAVDDPDKTGSFVCDLIENRADGPGAQEIAADRPRPSPHAFPAIAGFRIIREIGRGGMGVVYEALEETLSRRVALKVLPTNALSDSKQVQRFEREARAAARLHHTNIVPVFGVGQDGGLHYYVMQYIDGLGLDAVLNERRRLREAQSALRRAAADSTEPPSQPAAPVGRLASAATDSTASGRPPSRSPVIAPAVRESPLASFPLPSAQTGSTDLLSTTGLDRRYYESVARVGLLVAEALEYANRQGVLHRDIKPSNLLLDITGNVWVTDFGLAKTADADDLTQSGDILGTLRYMAAERFQGQCDARADIYSLGLTLYELIALKPAYDGSDRYDLIDRIRHEEPPRLKKQVPTVPRDLETIIHKASALETSARYASAAAMAEDLRRFIEDRPILARQFSTTERFVRWCRRNTRVAIALGVVFLLTIAWTVTATNLWRRAEEARDRADGLFFQAEGRRIESDQLRGVAEKRRIIAEANQKEADAQRLLAEAGFAKAKGAVDEFLSEVTDNQLLTAPGFQSLRRDLLSKALAFYEDFLRQRRSDPGLQSALAGVHYRVGVIQRELGAEQEARRAFLAGRSIYERLAEAKPDDLSVQEGLADCLVRLGADADGIAIWERLVKAEPDNLRLVRSLADAYNALGNSQSNAGKVADALQTHQKALALRRTVVEKQGDDPRARSGYGGSLNNIGTLLQRLGNFQGALEMYLRAVAHAEAAFAKMPQVVIYGQFLGTSYRNAAGMFQQLGRREEAARWLDKSVGHWRRVARENPDAPLFTARLYGDLLWRAQVLRELGRAADSALVMREAADVIDRLPTKTSLELYNLACVRAWIAGDIDQKKDAVTADEKDQRERMAEGAIDALKRALADSNQDWSQIEHDHDLDAVRSRSDFQALITRLRAATKLTAASSQQKGAQSSQEKLNEQQELLKDADRLSRENPASKWNRVDLGATQLAIGRLFSDLQRFDEAQLALEKAIAVYGGLVRENPDTVRYRLDAASAQMALAKVHLSTLRLDQADRERTASLREMESALRGVPAESELWVELDNARLAAADQLLKSGLWDEAAPLFDLVYRRDPTSLLRNAGLEWSTHAVLRLLSGDAHGYQESCARFYDRFKMTGGSKFNIYRACVAGPGAIDHLPALAAMAETDAVSSSYDNWQLLLDALLYARAGQYAKAQSEFDRISTNFAQASYILPGRAVVHRHLGRGPRARAMLEQSDRFAEETFRNVLNSPIQAAAFPYAEVYLMFEALRRDAHRQIEGKLAADVPWRHLFRGRLLALMGRDQAAAASFDAALAMRPADRSVRAEHARVLAELARQPGRSTVQLVARKLLDRSLAKWPNDPDLLKARGDLSASRGQWDKAGADLNRFLAATPAIAPRCLIAACWVAGPFPFKNGRPAALEFLEDPPSAGTDVDPFQPVPKPDNKGRLPWRPLALEASGFIDLKALIKPTDYTSAYVLTRVYAPQDLRTALLTACDDQLRLWLNGTLISRQNLHLRETAVPVHLRAGWNTLLTKVNNWTQGFMLKQRFSSDGAEIARGFGVYLDQNQWSFATAEVLSGLYLALPPNPAAWAPRAWLDGEVARREHLFSLVLADRPTDTQLWIARGRYLAWLGRWRQALSAYDNGIHVRPGPDDALDEYASVLLLAGDASAYRRWCEELAQKLEAHPLNYASLLLARAGTLAPRTFDDPTRLVRWAERGVRDSPKDPHSLYILGLCCLRAGRLDEAVHYFHASLSDPRHWLDPSNWLGLALAHHHLGHASEARGSLQKARDWIQLAERNSANKYVAHLPPMALTDWVEVLVLRREAEALILYDPIFPADPFTEPAVRRAP